MSCYCDFVIKVDFAIEGAQPAHAVPVMLPKGAGIDMRRIIQANIERLKNLLSLEIDPIKRAMELRLLVEEEEKLRQLPPYHSKEPKAF